MALQRFSALGIGVYSEIEECLSLDIVHPPPAAAHPHPCSHNTRDSFIHSLTHSLPGLTFQSWPECNEYMTRHLQLNAHEYSTWTAFLVAFFNCPGNVLSSSSSWHTQINADGLAFANKQSLLIYPQFLASFVVQFYGQTSTAPSSRDVS